MWILSQVKSSSGQNTFTSQQQNIYLPFNFLGGVGVGWKNHWRMATSHHLVSRKKDFTSATSKRAVDSLCLMQSEFVQCYISLRYMQWPLLLAYDFVVIFFLYTPTVHAILQLNGCIWSQNIFIRVIIRDIWLEIFKWKIFSWKKTVTVSVLTFHKNPLTC